jgi:DNA-binding NarL/FixJ family response regulator
MNARIVVLEDEWLIAANTERILTRAGYRVPAVLTNADGFSEALVRLRPDLVLVDVRLAGADGIEVVRQASKAVAVAVPVLYVSAWTDADTMQRASSTLCRGFVVKPFTEQQLLASVQLALTRSPTDQARAAPTAGADGASQTERVMPALLERLSPRESEIVEALVLHRRTARVAKALFISPHTVRNHLKSIFSKLGVHSQEELLDVAVGAEPPGEARSGR